jgi:murein DD-endopeptidase MepM/ murein hydrolase activator NlpD
MDSQKLLSSPKPQAQPRVVARVSKLGNLVKASTRAKKSTDKLRNTFEKGLYQKRTQLTVLNRYKRRLDAIQKEKDARYAKKLKTKPRKDELKVPKFRGKFFSKQGDPLLGISALAAINAFDKLLDGDILGALSPGLIAAGALMAPGLLGLGLGAVEGMFNRGPKPRRGFDVTGRRVTTGTQNRYRQRYGDRAFKNRFGKDALRRSKQGGSTATRATSTAGNAVSGGRVARAFGRFGGSIVPGLGAVVGAADAAIRASEGDVTGAAISGTAASLDAFAAASAATGIGLPLAGLASIGSFALDLVNLTRDLIGHSDAEIERNSKLKEQTEKEKALSATKSNLTFSKTLDSYSFGIKKFEEFANKYTKKTLPGLEKEEYPGAVDVSKGGGYEGPISGETFFPLPGGQEGTQPGQQFGASRDGGSRSHQGLDMVKFEGDLLAPVVAYKTGRVVAVSYAGYNGYVQLDHGGGLQTLYYHITPSVEGGTVVYGGQQVGNLYDDGQNTHLHFAIIKDGTKVDPKQAGTGKNRITEPLSKKQAKEHDSKVEGANTGKVFSGSDKGYPAILHGMELVLPIHNQHIKSGGDPLQNIPPEVINKVLSKSKIYQSAMNSLPPEVINVPMPMSLPKQSQPVSNPMPMPLNTGSGGDKRLIKMLYYNSLG